MLVNDSQRAPVAPFDLSAPLIASIAGAEPVARKKPAPDVHLWALEHLGIKAADCVAIDDSNVGLRAALSAGLPTIVAVSDYTAKGEFTGAYAVLTELGERGRPARCIDGIRPTSGLVDT